MSDDTPGPASPRQYLVDAMEEERARPSPSGSRQYQTLMRQMEKYVRGSGISWPVFSDGIAAMCQRFESGENFIVALERFFLALGQEGVALMAKRKRR